MFEELNPPYATIVADPPWRYDRWGAFGPTSTGGDTVKSRPLPYPSMPVDEIAAMPVEELAAKDSNLYLWTTNRYLRQSYSIVEGWGFKPSQMLVWCKPPMGIGPGGAFSSTTEFVLYCRRGKLPYKSRLDTTWWEWSRGGHSVKPREFMDVVEQVSPGPYVELFARQARAGWDAWGNQVGEIPYGVQESLLA